MIRVWVSKHSTTPIPQCTPGQKPMVLPIPLSLPSEQLPESLYGKNKKSRFEDEDFAQEIHLQVQSLNKKYLKAVDIVWYLDKPEVKSRLGLKNTPSEHTAHQCMHVMKYQYGKADNGMYVDGHECKDVVNY